MASAPVEYRIQARDHMPSPVEWVSFVLSFLLLIVVLYGAGCYLSYRSETAAARSSAARRLEDIQKPWADPAGADLADIRSRLQIDRNDHFVKDQTAVSNETSRTPSIVLCATRCSDEGDQVQFDLAYGIHYERSAGTDSWDFWFAPVQRGHWVADPARVLYRINPNQGDAWGLIDGSWTDSDVGFSANKVASIEELGDTPLAAYLHEVVDDQRVDAANRIEAPVESLTRHSDFADRALLVNPPGWQAAGSTLEDIRARLPDFISEASSDRTLAQWLGDNWSGLLTVLLLLVTVIRFTIKGWWGVGVYYFYRLLDELETKKVATRHGLQGASD